MSRTAKQPVEVECPKCHRRYMYSRADRKGSTLVACNSCRVKKRRRLVKQMAVDYKGGKCVICGYSKSNAALEFHHIDPSQKKFSMGAKGHTRSWASVKAEIDKCVLVCSNCHHEIEAGDTESPLLS